MEKNDIPEIQMLYENLVAVSSLYNQREEMKDQISKTSDATEKLMLEDLLTQFSDEIDSQLGDRDDSLLNALKKRRPDIKLMIEQNKDKFYMGWTEGDTYCYRTNVPEVHKLVSHVQDDLNNPSVNDDISKYFKRF